MKKAGCPVNQVMHKGKCVSAITGYHITDIDSWKKIKKQGMVPGTQSGPWQCYKPHWTGTYIFATKWQAKDNQDQMLDLDPDAKRSDFPIIEVKIPDVKEFHTRMRPDEDWSKKPGDWKRWKDEGSACVLGKIIPKYLKKIG